MASAEKRGKGKRPWRARYKKPDGTWGSEPGFATKAAALKWGNDRESDVRAGRYRDPRGGDITLERWFEVWLGAQAYAPSSVDRFKSLFKCHLQPWRGSRPIREIRMLDVQAFENEKAAQFTADTLAGIMGLLRALMDDAVGESRLDFSPVPSRRRRGRLVSLDVKPGREGVAISLEAFLKIAFRLPECGALGSVALMAAIVTVFTGMRWGETFGMQRKYLTLMPAQAGAAAAGFYVIDSDEGALHVPDRGPRYLGTPKGYVGRTVELPPFLVELLLVYLAWLPPDQEMLFVNQSGGMMGKGGGVHDAWRKACDGWPARNASRRYPAKAATVPLVLGLVWHDLRHTHKSWLAEDGIAAAARDERLGHGRAKRARLAEDVGHMDSTYVHATPVMRARLLEALQKRWRSALAETTLLEELISRSFPSRSAETAAVPPGRQSDAGRRVLALDRAGGPH